MSQTAIIQILGKQHHVKVGDQLVINRLEGEVDKKIVLKDILMIVDGDKSQVGEPIVAGASVELKVVEHGKGDTIRVFKYKSKSRYRKTHGHRQPQTTVEVVKISA